MAATRATSRFSTRLSKLGLWTATVIVAPLVTGGLLLIAPSLVSAPHRPAVPQAASSTQISLVNAWVGTELSAGYTEVGSTQLTANCIAGSEADYGNPSALRCFAGDSHVYDPCFANGDGSLIACPSAPWSTEVVVLNPRSRPNLLHPYVSERQVDAHTPWGVALGNGERCVFLGGTGAPTVAGVRIYDQCERGQIVGDVVRTGTRWGANYLPQGATSTRAVPVRVAWF